MAIPEAQSYLAQEPGVQHAFDIVNQLHFLKTVDLTTLQNLPINQAGIIAADYTLASAGYFANHSTDPYLQEVGTLAWNTIERDELVTIVYTHDARVGGEVIGFPKSFALTLLPDHPAFAIRASKSGPNTGYLVFPPHQIIRSKTNPTESLAAMAAMFSHVRDQATNRVSVDPENVKSRADATEAQFLIHALQENPEVMIGNYYMSLLTQYPNGIESLPDTVRY